MISMITAKMGTPRMNAAKFRWICATAHTARREPSTGKARYAGSLAACWASAGSATKRAAAINRRHAHVLHRTAVVVLIDSAPDGDSGASVRRPSRQKSLFAKSHERSGQRFRANWSMCQAERRSGEFDTPHTE